MQLSIQIFGEYTYEILKNFVNYILEKEGCDLASKIAVFSIILLRRVSEIELFKCVLGIALP